MAIIQQNRRGISGRNYVTRKSTSSSRYPSIIECIANRPIFIQALSSPYQTASVSYNATTFGGFEMVPDASGIIEEKWTSIGNSMAKYTIPFELYTALYTGSTTGEKLFSFVPMFTTVPDGITSSLYYNSSYLSQDMQYTLNSSIFSWLRINSGLGGNFDASKVYGISTSYNISVSLNKAEIISQYYYDGENTNTFYDSLEEEEFNGLITTYPGYLDGRTSKIDDGDSATGTDYGFVIYPVGFKGDATNTKLAFQNGTKASFCSLLNKRDYSNYGGTSNGNYVPLIRIQTYDENIIGVKMKIYIDFQGKED